MSKKLIVVLGVIVFLFLARFALASLSINEIMYDLSGSDSVSSKSREWIEIYNSGPENISVDASKWRIHDGTSNKTINGEVDFTISAGSYVVLAGDKDTFLADNVGFFGIVYDTGITSLNNTGATLKILDQDGNALDTVTYASTEGGVGDGNSLQKISGSWKGLTPTPGIQNQDIAPASTSGGGLALSASNEAPINTTTNTETKSKTTEEQKIKTQITAKALGFVGLAIPFSAKTYGLEGEQLYSGKYFWNFGDGDSKEIKLPEGQQISHSYFYPGEYIVSLDYYQNYYSEAPDASSQIVIKVVSANIIISNVGDEKDFFIELTNNTDYNADISNYFLISDKKSFSFPRNTILVSKKKMIIAPQISGFSFEDKNSLKLINLKREVIFDYSPHILAKNITKENNIPIQISRLNSNKNNLAKADISAIDLTATAINSVGGEDSSSYKFPYIPIVSTVFIGVSAYVVYFIRRKKTTGEYGSDFEILDE